MNKILVSLAIAIILIIGINRIADSVFHVEKPKKSAYEVANVTTAASTTSSSSENSDTGNIMALFASVSSADGEKVFKKCVACHTIAKGGSNKIGPSLWGVLGRKAGTVSNYKYSKAMIAYGKSWSFDEMNGFLKNPKEWIKGTKMSFAGLKKETDRAAIIIYMNKNTDNPLPAQ
tara:strand:- start:213 stop:737 length:525 start_codon:yes stop_codon:yes gene_type:complete